MHEKPYKPETASEIANRLNNTVFELTGGDNSVNRVEYPRIGFLKVITEGLMADAAHSRDESDINDAVESQMVLDDQQERFGGLPDNFHQSKGYYIKDALTGQQYLVSLLYSYRDSSGLTDKPATQVVESSITAIRMSESEENSGLLMSDDIERGWTSSIEFGSETPVFSSEVQIFVTGGNERHDVEVNNVDMVKLSDILGYIQAELQNDSDIQIGTSPKKSLTLDTQGVFEPIPDGFSD
jgi:hypothetical protein